MTSGWNGIKADMLRVTYKRLFDKDGDAHLIIKVLQPPEESFGEQSKPKKRKPRTKMPQADA
jgi:hypothetical protein